MRWGSGAASPTMSCAVGQAGRILAYSHPPGPARLHCPSGMLRKEFWRRSGKITYGKGRMMWLNCNSWGKPFVISGKRRKRCRCSVWILLEAFRTPATGPHSFQICGWLTFFVPGHWNQLLGEAAFSIFSISTTRRLRRKQLLNCVCSCILPRDQVQDLPQQDFVVLDRVLRPEVAVQLQTWLAQATIWHSPKDGNSDSDQSGSILQSEPPRPNTKDSTTSAPHTPTSLAGLRVRGC